MLWSSAPPASESETTPLRGAPSAGTPINRWGWGRRSIGRMAGQLRPFRATKSSAHQANNITTFNQPTSTSTGTLLPRRVSHALADSPTSPASSIASEVDVSTPTMLTSSPSGRLTPFDANAGTGSSPEPVLGASNINDLHDAYASAVLSEVIYKGIDFGDEIAERAKSLLQSMLPVEISLGPLQWSTGDNDASQAYCLAETDDAVYVAFLGTKRGLDILVSFHAKGVTDFLPVFGPEARFHKGYVLRAVQVIAEVEALFAMARSKGKRLVLTGHSMGGAVAQLCALKLMAQEEENVDSVRVVGFATPPIGNRKVAEAVRARGWNTVLRNYMLPEDWVPRAVALLRKPTGSQQHIHNIPKKRTISITVGADGVVSASDGNVVDDLKELVQSADSNGAALEGMSSGYRKSLSRGTKSVVSWLFSTLQTLAMTTKNLLKEPGSLTLAAAELALALPRCIAPKYVGVGHQVYLRRPVAISGVLNTTNLMGSAQPAALDVNLSSESISGYNNPSSPSTPRSSIMSAPGLLEHVQSEDAGFAVDTSSRTDRPLKRGASLDHNLVPLVVPNSPIAMHRMVSYRTRMLELHAHETSTNSFPSRKTIKTHTLC